MKKIFILLVLSLSIFSCKDKSKDNDNIFAFREYIFETTSGVVSVQNPINISFVKEIVNYSENSELKEGVIQISPKIEGKYVVVDKHNIQIIPDKFLLPDTEYTVKVALKKLFINVPKDYKKFQFQFKTIAPNFSIDTRDLQSYSKKWQYLEAYLHAADVMSIEDCKSIIKAEQDGKPLSVKWQELNNKSFIFTIDSIQRKVENSEIQISWNGEKAHIKNKGKNKVLIPGQNNFIIMRVDVIQHPEQYLEINFSDPLKKRQNFAGLVNLQGQSNLKYAVDGNVLKVYPNHRIIGNVLTEVFAGIKSVDGFKLKKTFNSRVAFEQIKPAVRLINQGVILPNSQDLFFNFEAVNLQSVDVRIIKIFENNVLQFLQNNSLNSNNSNSIRQVGRRVALKKMPLITNPKANTGKWKAYAVDLSKMIKTEPGAIYRVELSFKMEDAIYACSEEDLDDDDEDYYDDDYYYDYDTEASEDDEEREEQYWDNLIYRYKYYTYNWRQRDNPCHAAYYNEDRVVATNILASNLGVIAKRGNNQTYYFVVSDIISTKPVAQAQVTLYNYQQQEIAQLTTNTEGMAQYKADKNAYFAVVSNGVNKTYIKLDDGNSLSLSKFNVSGKKLKKGLKGYLYGERGVWRPGDSLHLTFVLNDQANPIPNGHPIRFELRDARGQLVNKQLSNHQPNLFHTFIVPTDVDAPTGTWNASVKVGGVTFHKQLKIATIKPNRLKINIDFGDSEVIQAAQGINGELSVNWLHGAPAKNIKTEVKMKLASTATHFENYPNYVFNDPTRSFDSEEISIFDGKLNNDGKANVYKKLPDTSTAPGMLKATFLTRAFENGGDFSMDVFSKKISPYASYVGLHSPEARAYGSYYTDEDTTFDLVCVNGKGEPLKRKKDLQLRVYKINW
jgi:uncharacterized protein YfaS (alpha-2-macroglobulin family)